MDTLQAIRLSVMDHLGDTAPTRTVPTVACTPSSDLSATDTSGTQQRFPVRGTTNPDHHLWSNHGVWFLHHTIYPTPWTKERRRFSLKTRSRELARLKRDAYFRVLTESGDPDLAKEHCLSGGGTSAAPEPPALAHSSATPSLPSKPDSFSNLKLLVGKARAGPARAFSTNAIPSNTP